MVNRISDMENKKEGYDRVISEGEDAYTKIIEITSKLVSNINSVVNNNQERFFSSKKIA